MNHSLSAVRVPILALMLSETTMASLNANREGIWRLYELGQGFPEPPFQHHLVVVSRSDAEPLGVMSGPETTS